MKYQVNVEGRSFEIEIGPDSQVYVDQQPVNVDLESIDGMPLYSLLVDHRSYETHVEEDEDEACHVVVAGRSYRARLNTKWQHHANETPPELADSPMEVCAPLPGLLIEMRVTEGQTVKKGQTVAVVDSMKMNLELGAPRSGVVETLCGTCGQEVAQGQVLAIIGNP